MAKRSKRVAVKGFLDLDRGIIIEDNKELGEVEHNIADLMLDFNGNKNVSINISIDEEILPL